MKYICCVLASGNCSTNILYSFVMVIDGHGLYSMNWFNKISSRLQRICPEVERHLTLCTLWCFSLLPSVLLEACSNKHRVLFFCTSKKQAHVFTIWYDSCHIIMFTHYKELRGNLMLSLLKEAWFQMLHSISIWYLQRPFTQICPGVTL